MCYSLFYKFILTHLYNFDSFIQWPRKVWKLLVELPPFTRGLMGEWLLRKAVKSREGNVAEFIFGRAERRQKATDFLHFF